MRSEPMRLVLLLSLAAAAGCVQSAEKRAEHTAARQGEQGPVRASPTVERVATPRDSGRILYDAATDLSDTTTRATRPLSSP